MSQKTKQIFGQALAKGLPVNVSGDEMMTLAATCSFFGGDRPINPATLYRGIKVGRYPPPVHLGSRSSRWLRTECVAARQALINARDADLEAA
jgi:predicted DNA-binding transcriptional regulator AlpA